MGGRLWQVRPGGQGAGLRTRGQGSELGTRGQGSGHEGTAQNWGHEGSGHKDTRAQRSGHKGRAQNWGHKGRSQDMRQGSELGTRGSGHRFPAHTWPGTALSQGAQGPTMGTAPRALCPAPCSLPGMPRAGKSRQLRAAAAAWAGRLPTEMDAVYNIETEPPVPSTTTPAAF